jgi:hypothetical protein
MQLGLSLAEITRWVHDQQPDIVGISATFGQYDLLSELLDWLDRMPVPPLVLPGGSLTVRNEALLLERHPRLLIARGAGESTIADAMSYFHGDRDLPDIRGIGYHGAPWGGAITIGGRPRHTAVAPSRLQDGFLPELDLLDAALACQSAELTRSRSQPTCAPPCVSITPMCSGATTLKATALRRPCTQPTTATTTAACVRLVVATRAAPASNPLIGAVPVRGPGYPDCVRRSAVQPSIAPASSMASRPGSVMALSALRTRSTEVTI